MHHAVTTGIVCFCLVLAQAAPAGEGTSDAAATIAQALRLIDAKDYTAATTLLEDLLLEVKAKDRAKILGILRQSYEVMAREALAAGRDREAAHYRDNLAILGVSKLPPEPAGPVKPRTAAPLRPESTAEKIAAAVEKVKAQAPKADLTTLISAPKEESIVPAPAEPAPLGQPANEPKPERDPGRPPELRPKRPAAVSQVSGPGNPVIDLDNMGPAAKDAAPATAPPAVQQAPSSVAPVSIDAAPRPAATGRPPAGPTLEEADRLFSAKKYNEAGQCYLALAQEKRLPAERANHWAYCRIVGVAVRMNAKPKSTREWDEIEAEIQSIQRLAPNLWYAEYLRNKLAEVRQGRSRMKAQSDNVVVRGSAPDDSQAQPRRFPRLFGKSRAAAATADATAVPVATAPTAGPENAQQALNLAGPKPSFDENIASDDRPRAAANAALPFQPASRPVEPPTGDGSATSAAGGALQVHETANFRIFHADARLAEKAGEAAEIVRAAQARRWGSTALQKPWTPRCDLYLYPNGAAFAEATGQPETSPGFSTMENNGSRITLRRVFLRADNPRVLAAVLPHEVTHVVLADLFIVKQIPRWADEGIAVLAEPNTEQHLRALDLHDSLAAGQTFELRKLMSVETPDAKDWSVYYAQSVSLTRFLVERGTPEQLIQFVRESHRKGIEPALRDVYHLGGFADLQARWQAYAREQLASNKLAEAGEKPPAQASAIETQ
jgi:hypothetical protein